MWQQCVCFRSKKGRRWPKSALVTVVLQVSCRHLYSAVVGKSSSTLFKMSWDDYQQISATYVDDSSRAVEQVIANLDDSGNVDKSQSSMNSATSVGEGNQKVKSTIEEAVKRQNSESTIAMLDSVAEGDIDKVNSMLQSGKVSVDDADYDSRTALHIACSLNKLEIAKLLLEKYSATHTVRCAQRVVCGTVPPVPLSQIRIRGPIPEHSSCSWSRAGGGHRLLMEIRMAAGINLSGDGTAGIVLAGSHLMTL